MASPDQVSQSRIFANSLKGLTRNILGKKETSKSSQDNNSIASPQDDTQHKEDNKTEVHSSVDKNVDKTSSPTTVKDTSLEIKEKKYGKKMHKKNKKRNSHSGKHSNRSPNSSQSIDNSLSPRNINPQDTDTASKVSGQRSKVQLKTCSVLVQRGDHSDSTKIETRSIENQSIENQSIENQKENWNDSIEKREAQCLNFRSPSSRQVLSDNNSPKPPVKDYYPAKKDKQASLEKSSPPTYSRSPHVHPSSGQSGSERRSKPSPKSSPRYLTELPNNERDSRVQQLVDSPEKSPSDSRGLGRCPKARLNTKPDANRIHRSDAKRREKKHRNDINPQKNIIEEPGKWNWKRKQISELANCHNEKKHHSTGERVYRNNHRHNSDRYHDFRSDLGKPKKSGSEPTKHVRQNRECTQTTIHVDSEPVRRCSVPDISNDDDDWNTDHYGNPLPNTDTSVFNDNREYVPCHSEQLNISVQNESEITRDMRDLSVDGKKSWEAKNEYNEEQLACLKQHETGKSFVDYNVSHAQEPRTYEALKGPLTDDIHRHISKECVRKAQEYVDCYSSNPQDCDNDDFYFGGNVVDVVFKTTVSVPLNCTDAGPFLISTGPPDVGVHHQVTGQHCIPSLLLGHHSQRGRPRHTSIPTPDQHPAEYGMQDMVRYERESNTNNSASGDHRRFSSPYEEVSDTVFTSPPGDKICGPPKMLPFPWRNSSRPQQWSPFPLTEAMPITPTAKSINSSASSGENYYNPGEPTRSCSIDFPPPPKLDILGACLRKTPSSKSFGSNKASQQINLESMYEKYASSQKSYSPISIDSGQTNYSSFYRSDRSSSVGGMDDMYSLSDSKGSFQRDQFFSPAESHCTVAEMPTTYRNQKTSAVKNDEQLESEAKYHQGITIETNLPNPRHELNKRDQKVIQDQSMSSAEGTSPPAQGLATPRSYKPPTPPGFIQRGADYIAKGRVALDFGNVCTQDDQHIQLPENRANDEILNPETCEPSSCSEIPLKIEQKVTTFNKFVNRGCLLDNNHNKIDLPENSSMMKADNGCSASNLQSTVDDEHDFGEDMIRGFLSNRHGDISAGGGNSHIPYLDEADINHSEAKVKALINDDDELFYHSQYEYGKLPVHKGTKRNQSSADLSPVNTNQKGIGCPPRTLTSQSSESKSHSSELPGRKERAPIRFAISHRTQQQLRSISKKCLAVNLKESDRLSMSSADSDSSGLYPSTPITQTDESSSSLSPERLKSVKSAAEKSRQSNPVWSRRPGSFGRGQSLLEKLVNKPEDLESIIRAASEFKKPAKQIIQNQKNDSSSESEESTTKYGHDWFDGVPTDWEKTKMTKSKIHKKPRKLKSESDLPECIPFYLSHLTQKSQKASPPRSHMFTGPVTAESKQTRHSWSSMRSEASSQPLTGPGDKLSCVRWQNWKDKFQQRYSTCTTQYIDTHCHLDFLFDRGNFQGTFTKFRMKNTETFPSNFAGCVAVFCNPRSFKLEGGLWKDLLEDSNIWGAVGCHPKCVCDLNDRALDAMEEIIKHPKVMAVGEIGLDFSGMFGRFASQQKEAFIRQLEMALRVNKPIVIHCRDAEEDCLKIMTEMVPADHFIHRHCFTGSWQEAEAWLTKFPNCYIGLTPLVTWRTSERASGPREVAAQINLDRLVLETDAPYFVPKRVPRDEMPLSHPGMAITVADEVAYIRGMPLDYVLEHCLYNSCKLYGIKLT